MGNVQQNSVRSNSTNINRDLLDPKASPICIGGGELGGKATGLIAVRQVLHEGLNPEDFGGIEVNVPAMAILCTDAFDAFMQHNDLYDLATSGMPDNRIAHAFQQAELPFEILGDLRTIIEQVHTPLAVRSSSLLEDALRAPFAGVYSTKMIPNSAFDPDIRFRQLAQAIKYVYASTYQRMAKDYCVAIERKIEDEKMAVIIQEMVGKRHHNRFYPELSAVARSYNYYPLKPAKPEDGVVDLALGLGKTIVDGGITWTYSPAYPKIEPPFGSVESLLKETQINFWTVNMGELPEYDPTQETEYMHLENITVADRDGTLRYLASTYSPLTGRLTPGISFPGPRALTFAPLLVLNELPLNDLLLRVLDVCKDTFHCPVEIEAAMTFDPPRFAFLQVRPMIIPTGDLQVAQDELTGKNVLVASEAVLGNGLIETIQDIVFVKPETFEMQHTQKMAADLQNLNDQFLERKCPYVLIVFGRLGTTDPWLGIPAKWGQVCGAAVIVESTRDTARVELSQGSHYFHNVINLGIKYFTLPYSSPYQVDWEWLETQQFASETQFIRHVRLDKPLKIKVDGRNGRGVINKS